MTRAEEIALNERNKERNLRYIRAKIVHANAEEMALLKGFVHGLGIVGWEDAEPPATEAQAGEEVQNNEPA